MTPIAAERGALTAAILTTAAAAAVYIPSPPPTHAGAVMMQMSPPASPRVSASHLLARGSSLGGASGHRVMRRQLVAVHESVPVLEVGRQAGFLGIGAASCESCKCAGCV